MKCTITIPKQCNFHKKKTFTNQFKSFRTSFMLLKRKTMTRLNKAWKNEICVGPTCKKSYLNFGFSGLPTLIPIYYSMSFVKNWFHLKPRQWVAFCACLGPTNSLMDSLGGRAQYILICMPSLEHVPKLVTCFAFVFVFLFVASIVVAWCILWWHSTFGIWLNIFHCCDIFLGCCKWWNFKMIVIWGVSCCFEWS
jgi:hypothetical protein